MAMSLSHCRLCGRFVRYLYSVSGQYTGKSIQIHPSSIPTRRQFTSSSVIYCKNEESSDSVTTANETSQNKDEGEKSTTKTASNKSKPKNTEGKKPSENVNQKLKENKKKKKASKEKNDSDDIYDKLESAAKDVASSLKQKGKETELELLNKLRKHRDQKQSAEGENIEAKSQEFESVFRSIISDMKHQKNVKENFYHRENAGMKRQDAAPGELGRDNVNEMERRDRRFGGTAYKKSDRQFRQTEEFSNYELFPGKGLGIFQKGKDYPIKDDQSLWAKLEREEYEDLQYKFIPYNAFDEMILLTRENRLWKFPVDNEQDMEAEKEVPFYDHIFLEDLIKDFPKKGPIRNFMELVIVGLSKNPYITVQEKREHIEWYRNYFTEREGILKEALGDDGLIRTVEPSEDSSVESEV